MGGGRGEISTASGGGEARTASSSPPPSPPLAAALRLGVASMAAGALGFAWELLARQAPSSPWRVPGFPAAIERFALRAWLVGLAVFVLAPRALDAAAPLGARPRLAAAVVAAAHAGAALALGALAYSGATGVLAIQLREPEGAHHAVLAARLAGDALLLAALVVSARAALGASSRRGSGAR